MKPPKFRQSALFAAVLALPLAAVVIQGVQLSAYERDLARANIDEARDRFARDIGQRAIEVLEDLKQSVTANLGSNAEFEVGDYATDTVRLIGVELAGELRWPWDLEAAGADIEQTDGEADTFESRFAAARIAGDDAADEIYYALAGAPASARDAYDVSYWTYAALALTERVPDSFRRELLERFVAELRFPSSLGDLQKAQFARLLQALGPGSDAATQRLIDSLSGLVEKRSNDFHDLQEIQRRYPSMSVTPGTWQAYEGHTLWLIGKTSGTDRMAQNVFAVDAVSLAERVLVPEERRNDLRFGTDTGVPLGSGLVDLRVFIPDGSDIALTRAGPDVPSFYEVTVLLAISLALVVAYFFWRDARREAAIADLRSQFVSGVSHELKTPLTSIRMFAETLQIADETGAGNAQKRAEYLETIIRESERLTRLLNNVLAFAQIERGQRTYHMQRVYLQDIVDESARMMQFPLSEQGIELVLTVSDDVPPVQADRDALQQAVLNLLSNAMKFSGESRRIELSLARHADEAVIAVADHGVGIPDSESQRIFDSFYRVPNVPSGHASGTGLGLAIVDDIVRAHEGSISVDSRVGHGSTFRIRLPLAPGTIA